MSLPSFPWRCLAALAALLAQTACLQVFAETTARQTTYCNPLDIDYRYNFEQKEKGISYRSGADPVIVNHNGTYLLFATISGGWWYSSDLVNWTFVKPDVWPREDMCAPAALSVRNQIYLFQSTFDRRPIYRISDPKSGHLEVFNRGLPYMPGAQGPWDPAIFHDEDTDRWFMYFGSSNLYPIYGVELNYSNKLNYIETARELITLHPDLHGWERFGRDHRESTKPFIEGAWMTKHSGKYYLQYAAPGTEYNVYANGTYVGDSPLGPFTYASNNPVSYKPGGFMTGAGHGNTFQDKYGNYWNTGTPWVAVNFPFERRIAMFPAGFDSEGLLYSNTRFGDFPHYLPKGKLAGREELFAGWMLLSYGKPCKASSFVALHNAQNVTDENPRSFWLASTNRSGEWLTIDLRHACEVHALQVNFTDFKSGLFGSESNIFTQFKISHSLDGSSWSILADLSHESRDRPNAYLELQQSVRTRFIKYEHIYTASHNLALSDIRVFGIAGDHSPATPSLTRVRRDSDRRNAFVSWRRVKDVVGYNVLWGIRPDKLYETYQVFADSEPELEIRALTTNQEYYFAVEAFNEHGVSGKSQVVHVK